MAVESISIEDREVLVCSPTEMLAIQITNPFAVLVSSQYEKERGEVLSLFGALLERGCKEICCIGTDAELLHDQFDQLIEDAGAVHVATTWHEDIVEGCEYFLFSAGGQSVDLYALISQHPELLNVLISVARE